VGAVQIAPDWKGEDMKTRFVIYRRNDFHRTLDSRRIGWVAEEEDLETAKRTANRLAVETPPMKQGGQEPLPATFLVDKIEGRYTYPQIFQTTI
jgi:hypothetical protein